MSTPRFPSLLLSSILVSALAVQCYRSTEDGFRYSCRNNSDCAKNSEHKFECTGVDKVQVEPGESCAPDVEEIFFHQEGSHCFFPFCLPGGETECGDGKKCPPGHDCVATVDSGEATFWCARGSDVLPEDDDCGSVDGDCGASAACAIVFDLYNDERADVDGSVHRCVTVSELKEPEKK